MWKWLDVSSLFVVLDWYAQLTRISYGGRVSSGHQNRTEGSHHLMNTSSVQCLHGSLGRAGVIVFDKPIIEALSLGTEE